MTTIAYRDGLMVADSMAWFGHGNPSPGSKLKLSRDPDGTLMGITSSCTGADAAIRHYLKYEEWPEGERPGDFAILRVDPQGRGYVAMDSINFSGPIRAPYFAIGSYGEGALAAMYLGANPWTAVEVACHFDKHSGPPLMGMVHTAPGVLRLRSDAK